MKLKIANWNVERPKPITSKTNLVLKKIVDVDADIFILTETSSAIDLSDIFPYQATTTSYQRTPKEQWVSVWSKYPIIQQYKTIDSNRTVSVGITTSIGNIVVYGTIIPYHMAGVKGIRYGNLNYKPWQFHLEDISNQSFNWDEIIASNEDAYFILAGDFNQTRGVNYGYGTTEARNILTEKLAKSRLKCLTEQNQIEKFLSIDSKKGNKRNNIDHICASEKLINICTDISVSAWNHFTEDGRYMSDHNGVAVQFIINP
ncbi:MAG: hypothetical protein U0T77_03680 [Chitinophagales bacterium]